MADVSIFETGFATHVGNVREHNEDRLLVRPDIGLWVVADGMGGHSAGDVASAALVDTLNTIQRQQSAAALLRACENGLIEANHLIRRLARERGVTVMGTTVVALLIFANHYACLWSGDSRAYLLQNGLIRQITRDHSEAMELLDKGVLTDAEARAWPRKNVITQAIGAAEKLDAEMKHGPLAPGDIFVLCSDGLTTCVNDAEIRSAIIDSAAQAAADRLIKVALQRGGEDNVTAVVVRFMPDSLQTVVKTYSPWE